MKLGELAKRLGCELRGDAEVEVQRVSPIEEAEPGDVSFVANPRYLRHLATTKASAVIVARDAPASPVTTLRAAEPYLAFARAIELFHQPLPVVPGIHATAAIAASAEIGPGASVGPFAVIGERTRIGADARIGPHVVIYPEVTIGDRFEAYAHVTVRERVRIGHDVIVHAGAVIGSDGFGYVAGADGAVRKIRQAGEVIVEDGVEIGANTTVDRATVGATRVRRGAKLDNLVMVAHGCEIGESTLLAAQVGLAGSTEVGRGVQMGGQAGAAGHLRIGDGARVAAQSGVANSVAPGATVGGYPAIDMAVWRRVSAALPKLPELLRRVRRLERAGGSDPDEEP
jgi:UDP-3-O-[3-hydroxymyristoyl] glucosamine N-acyltransferase